jgi:SPP1 gp7 family putative phage head morphogenesis protein
VWYRGDYERRGIFLAPDYSKIDVLQGDRKLQADIASVYVSGGIKTPNEVRAELNLPPVDGGDDLRQPKQFSGFGVTLSDIPSRRTKAVLPPTRGDQWKARDRDFLAAERKIGKAMASFFQKQGDRVVNALNGSAMLAEERVINPSCSLSAREIRATRFLSQAIIDTSVKKIERSDLLSIFDMDGENAEILAIMRPILESIVEQAGNGALASVGSAAQFKVTDPRVQAFLEKKDILIQGINETTSEAIRQILADASAEGASVAETGRRIRDQFDEFSKSRADTIARTEAVGANNAAAVEGYRQSGLKVRKEWLTQIDGATRESHIAADGQKVGLDEKFIVGDSEMDAPGVDGPPEEVINCRCTVLPVLED